MRYQLRYTEEKDELVVTVGFDPTTSPLSRECSTRLSYVTTCLRIGSSAWVRTRGLCINSAALCQD